MDFTTLCEIIKEAGYSPRSYSGRNMYGRQCVGFTVDRDIGLMRAMMDLIDNLDIDMESGNLYDLTKVIRSAQTDSMGMDTVIYFPHVTWQERD